MARSAAAATLPPAAVAEGVTHVVAEASRLKTRAIDRVAYASDASHFLLTPEAVLVAADAAEVGRVMREAGRSGSRLTFRSGGTSLSGQASTDGLLVDVRQRFRRIDVLDGGRRVRVQPGATVRQVNARLARHGFRLGPDPASELACTIGGVVNNNSSGMACGITENTYETLDSLVFVLPSGTVVDSGAPDADAALRAAEPDLVDGLARLRERVVSNPRSVEIIRRQFAMKNTMGYAVNAFLDFDTPAQLLAHLVVGSEGTLAFVAEATYRTVPILPRMATALTVFPDLAAATRALPALVATGAATLELMDATSLRVGQSLAGAPREITGLTVRDQAALLVEFHAHDDDELSELVARGAQALATQPLEAAASFSSDAVARAAAWKLRKGLYASVAGARPSGTTALLEDVVVPVDRLAPTCATLQALFERYAYDDSVIFGHAKDGNIHFMLTDRFESADQLARYRAFTEDMVELVLDAGGNLKAEHGTGRVMAPYVRRQYGDELYDVMRELKRLCDPAGILNPGVIIDDDPEAHLRNIKLADPIEPEADRCVECGYCEPVCPSRDLTLTPRQRIVTRRAIARAEASGDHALVRELERDYDYAGVDTCAVDGMCQTACPVLINTGTLVKRLRREEAGPVANAAWKGAAHAWSGATRVASLGLTVADRLPAPVVTLATDIGRAVLGADTVPRYSDDLPRGGHARSRLGTTVGTGDEAPVAVFLPACVNAMFGPAGDGVGVTEAFRRLAERAGVRLAVPDGVDALCCSTPWTSKGHAGGREVMARRVAASISDATRGGELTIVTDASSCTEGFLHLLADAGVDARVEDAVAFAERVLLPRLDEVAPLVGSLALHPTCSSTQLGLDPALRRVAEAVATEVIVPDAWSCCGFAGDRGMLHPELTASATASEAAEVRALGADAHASCNRTCELGMTRATGADYRHVLELLEEATRP
ncbi:FAD-binding and (Fe-S)-binding domain-containing protein [Microbacterium trichothecenolyticum]|uniref:D-lactate dehydrogenase (cytochrome) n=1 Tax=Microbacterium trichothecenolyticum TaxID=69370 RepID=A0A0M2H665_MICTR|nr:FAD-binding and (Fe-S)-binding domain-containing protein [Microbacterium trichothecenolyticum]KJL41831.1 putative FAD-linked oxidoreductase [Microbacterium trichothecenolyticum]